MNASPKSLFAGLVNRMNTTFGILKDNPFEAAAEEGRKEIAAKAKAKADGEKKAEEDRIASEKAHIKKLETAMAPRIKAYIKRADVLDYIQKQIEANVKKNPNRKCWDFTAILQSLLEDAEAFATKKPNKPGNVELTVARKAVIEALTEVYGPKKIRVYNANEDYFTSKTPKLPEITIEWR